jgi:hypothetical protein
MATTNLRIADVANLEAELLEESRLLREKMAATVTKAAPMTIEGLVDSLFTTMKLYVEKRLASSHKAWLDHWHPVNPSTIEALEKMLEHQKTLQREHEILSQRLEILESRR